MVLAKACGANTIVRDVVQQKAFDLPLDAAVFAEQKKFEALEAGAGGADATDGDGILGDDDERAASEFFRDKNVTEKGFDTSSYYTYVHGLLAQAGQEAADTFTIDKKHDSFWQRFLTKWDHVEHTVLTPNPFCLTTAPIHICPLACHEL